MDQISGSGIGGSDGMPPQHQQTHDAVGLAAGLDLQHMMLRHNIREKISEYLRRRPMTAKWQRRLPDLVKRLEEILFRKYPNKSDYYNMTMGPTESHFMFALTILSAQYQQCQQNQELSSQIASSGGYETTTLTAGITQGEAPDEHVNTVLSLGINPTQHDRSRVSNNNHVVNTVEASEIKRISPKVTPPPPVTLKEVPKEPKFSCPICLHEMVDASSTLCGHIFCQECIRASIKARRKCPTCRRKLNIRNFHRVYLPTMD